MSETRAGDRIWAQVVSLGGDLGRQERAAERRKAEGLCAAGALLGSLVKTPPQLSA